MRWLLDFLPIVLFVLLYKLQGIYAATAALMAATVAQMAVVWWLDRKLSALQKTTLVLVLVFGTLTLVLQDERFIKWKPTVLYAGMALALLAMLQIWRRNVLHMLLGTQLNLPPAVWQRLTCAWAGYFAFMAALNGVVAYAFSTDDWVNFKLWGYVFPIVFIVGQGFYIARHLPAEAEPPPDHDKP
ncbi:MAG: septation protein A [Burkholderiaceae bacterium]